MKEITDTNFKTADEMMDQYEAILEGEDQSNIAKKLGKAFSAITMQVVYNTVAMVTGAGFFIIVYLMSVAVYAVLFNAGPPKNFSVIAFIFKSGIVGWLLMNLYSIVILIWNLENKIHSFIDDFCSEDSH